MWERIDPTPGEQPKTEQDLIYVLNEYPNITIVQERLGNGFIIREKDEKGRESVLLNLLQFRNEDTQSDNPMISYNIPELDEYMYLEFTDNGLVLSGEQEYERAVDLMRIARGGIEMMLVYNKISTKIKIQIEEKYWDRVYDGGEVGDFPLFKLKNDFLQRALDRIKKELGE